MASKKYFGFFKEAKYTRGSDGSMDLELPPVTERELLPTLPNVSIITITKDRGAFSSVMLYNWVNLRYPREKLEWLILDDSAADTEYPLSDYLPSDDKHIRYIKLDKWYPVAEKRNKAVEMAKYDYIVHMDDDDYYFPDHVLVKVRLMHEYGKEGVHSMPIGVYDLMERTSIIWDSWAAADSSGKHNNDVSEASMAYKRSYWQRHKFVSSGEKGIGEGAGFVGKNFKHWVVVHFLFNMVSITHTKNVTANNRRFINEYKETVKTGNFEEVFPKSFNLILDNLRKLLGSNYTQPTTFKN